MEINLPVVGEILSPFYFAAYLPKVGRHISGAKRLYLAKHISAQLHLGSKATLSQRLPKVVSCISDDKGVYIY